MDQDRDDDWQAEKLLCCKANILLTSISHLLC